MLLDTVLHERNMNEHIEWYAGDKRKSMRAGGVLWEGMGLHEDLKRLRLVRGLSNDSGLNNCFLNVVIQGVWHLRSFREALLDLRPQVVAMSCIKIRNAGNSSSCGNTNVGLIPRGKLISSIGCAGFGGAGRVAGGHARASRAVEHLQGVCGAPRGAAGSRRRPGRPNRVRLRLPRKRCVPLTSSVSDPFYTILSFTPKSCLPFAVVEKPQGFIGGVRHTSPMHPAKNTSLFIRLFFSVTWICKSSRDLITSGHEGMIHVRMC